MVRRRKSELPGLPGLRSPIDIGQTNYQLHIPRSSRVLGLPDPCQSLVFGASCSFLLASGSPRPASVAEKPGSLGVAPNWGFHG